MKPRRVVLDWHSGSDLYFLALYEIAQFRRAKSEENPLIVIYGFTYTIENGLDIVCNFARAFKRNHFAFFVLPDFFACRKLFFSAYISRRVFANAVNIIMR